MTKSMKPREQILRPMCGLLWYLLPLSYVTVDKLLPFDRSFNIYPLILLQGSIACALLYWGIEKIRDRSARKIWIWMQAFATVAIFQMVFASPMIFTLWIDIPIFIVLTILWFFTFYKLMTINATINRINVRSNDKS